MIAGLLRAGSLVALAKGLRAETRHLVRRTVVGAVILFLVSVAFAFGLAAFMVWLALEIGTVPALGFVALGFLVLAGIFTLLARATDPRRRVAAPPRPRPITESVKQALDSVEAGAAAASSAMGSGVGSTAGSMLLVVLVGYLLARQISRPKKS